MVEWWALLLCFVLYCLRQLSLSPSPPHFPSEDPLVLGTIAVTWLLLISQYADIYLLSSYIKSFKHFIAS